MYTNSTGSLTFNPVTMEAHSYKWWKFVAIVEGKLVFNDFNYSVSTTKHQRSIRRLLEYLGYNIDLYLPLRQGITSSSLEDLILEAEEELCDKFFSDVLKKQDRYQRVKERKAALKLTKEYQTKEFNKKAEKLINSEVVPF